MPLYHSSDCRLAKEGDIQGIPPSLPHRKYRHVLYEGSPIILKFELHNETESCPMF